ncbi:ATP-binding protein [Acetivibrio mesophilus]|uniref:Anti-sigma regulatory factor n=1 Tax=Acetivibrio mesophilus TaxID=2487273 RepID=A0A4Q0I1L4_9FIRM|nr:ATP-binding protein [Acetivibrio mesophilus]ODM26751.1 anti-sigma regulatory factor [Clostridium sp. Bc-iso-3]RXE57547.1 anti-sigma regulatory factor [Acetivibrio mesophilus]
MNSVCDKIELTLPFKAEYVSVARLVASGVCNRIGFDIETIEDIKVAISEVCSKIVSIGSEIADNYTIVYDVSEDTLNVVYVCDDPSIKCIFDHERDGLAINIITALMDSVELCDKSNRIISMSKVLEGNR